VRIESLTVAGRVNFGLVATGLLVVLGTGVHDLAQVVIRNWRPNYETGLPSGLAFFGMWLAAVLLCVVIVAVAERR
jgi:hypothetical protein